MAEMTEQVAAVVAKVAGNNNVIVSGVQIVGPPTTLTDGWVVIGGELYPFFGGGGFGSHIRIVQNVEQVQYLVDNDNNGIGDFVDAYINRYAIPTFTADGNIPLSDFVRYEDLRSDVLRNGILSINPADQTGLVSGDFNDLEISTNSSNLYTYCRIYFPEVQQDYHVLITPLSMNSILSSFFPIEYAVSLQNETSFRIGFRMTDVNFITLGNRRFEITLIKK